MDTVVTPVPDRLSYGDSFSDLVYGRATDDLPEIRRKLSEQFETSFHPGPGYATLPDGRRTAYSLKHAYVRSDFADFIDIDPDTAMVSFIPAARKKVAMEQWYVYGSGWVDVWKSPLRQKMKPGRFLRSLLTEDTLKEFSSSDIERFANIAKAHCERQKCEIQVVRGGDIAYYYGLSGEDAGIDSCMQGEPDEYFDIYTSNPDRIGLLVATNCDGTLMGRALVWTLDDGTTFMDGTYGRDHIRTLFSQEAEKQGWITDLRKLGHERYVPLQHTTASAWPYIDTFRYIIDAGPRQGLYWDEPPHCTGTLNSTGGDRTYRCSECNDSISYRHWEDHDSLCRDCDRGRSCSYCGEEKEDRDDDYCESCNSQYICRGCEDFETSTDDSGYCRYCRPEYTCEGCGNVDEGVEPRYEQGRWGRESRPGYCDDCRPNYTCDTCLEVVGPDDINDAPDGMICTSCLDKATAPEEDKSDERITTN